MKRIFIISSLFLTSIFCSPLYFSEINVFDKVIDQCSTSSDLGLKNKVVASLVGLSVGCATIFWINNLYNTSFENHDTSNTNKKEISGVFLSLNPLNISSIVLGSLFGYVADELVCYRVKPENIAGRVSDNDAQLLKIIYLDENFVESDELKKLYNYKNAYLKQAWFGCKRIKRYLESIILSLNSIPQYKDQKFDCLKKDITYALDSVGKALNKIEKKLSLMYV